MDFADGGDLQKLIKAEVAKGANNYIDEDKILNWFT